MNALLEYRVAVTAVTVVAARVVARAVAARAVAARVAVVRVGNKRVVAASGWRGRWRRGWRWRGSRVHNHVDKRVSAWSKVYM